ncbi:MAG TPA: YidC/Oxa1 family membrane protein insertase [Candidatus Baltobacteraceae bacterium]|nr:YidC/Oxa1 family membrane protein insertase [Candidatus Baltobacteraceae bacterium]
MHNRGWSLVLFALGLKLLFWPLNTKQFVSMVKMQQLAPQLKKLQEKYAKADPQRYQQETMELYKKNGANPLAGCWPMLVQYPFIISVYYAVFLHKDLYANEHWLWIGSQFTQNLPVIPFWKAPLLAPNLGKPDLVLLVGYMISMYLFSRYATMPSTDPQQAQTQKMMAIISPLMLGYFGFQWKWPSAMVLYWFSYNVFTMAQQFYLLRRFHQPLSAIDDFHAITDISAAPADAKPAASNGAAKPRAQGPSPKTSSKKKKGAKR